MSKAKQISEAVRELLPKFQREKRMLIRSQIDEAIEKAGMSGSQYEKDVARNVTVYYLYE